MKVVEHQPQTENKGSKVDSDNSLLDICRLKEFLNKSRKNLTNRLYNSNARKKKVWFDRKHE